MMLQRHHHHDYCLYKPFELPHQYWQFVRRYKRRHNKWNCMLWSSLFVPADQPLQHHPFWLPKSWNRTFHRERFSPQFAVLLAFVHLENRLIQMDSIKDEMILHHPNRLWIKIMSASIYNPFNNAIICIIHCPIGKAGCHQLIIKAGIQVVNRWSCNAQSCWRNVTTTVLETLLFTIAQNITRMDSHQYSIPLVKLMPIQR